MTNKNYENFVGEWLLDVASCTFEQGDPPRAATNSITFAGGELTIGMDWIDTEGESHHMSFHAPPDGTRLPFNGGPLADSISMTAATEATLVTSAFRDGIELMTAVRTLSGDHTTMQLIQTVRLPDGTSPSNQSTYHRKQ
jgi:hypothetical protein